MQKIITSDMVNSLFTTMTLDDKSERIVYSKDYINAKDGTVNHDLYELVSNIAQNSGLSFELSYEVMALACGIVADLPIWQGDEIDSDDGLHEAIDNAVPVYNYDLLKMANVNDYYLIDEAITNDGHTSIIEACQSAWYTAINNAVYEIAQDIETYNNDN